VLKWKIGLLPHERKEGVAMGAKITLTGQARDVQKQERGISFYIVAGPATRHPPRGLKLFGPTRYHVECTSRQWSRARADPTDDSDLIVEGYLEPRRDPETGQLYVAVVATAMKSMLSHNAHKLEQLQDALEQAREAFVRAKSAEVDRETLEEKAAAFVRANSSVQDFVQTHPELAGRK
jgi:hypothetical protein